jgi:superkiller protein 3
MARGDHAGAIAALAEAIAAEPGNAEAHHLHAQALRKTGANQEALAAYREAARLSSSANIRGDLAKFLVSLGQNAEAVTVYESLIADQPDSYAYLQQLAALHAASGRQDAALPLLARAAELAPAKADVQQDLGYALEQSGRRPEAIAAYRRAIELDAASSVSRMRVAELLWAEGRRDEALAVVRAGLENSQTTPALQRSLGSLLERSGAVQEAIAAYREYARLAPGAPDAQEMAQRAAELERRANRS